MSLLGKAKGKQREPPPSLFLHPSPAASHVSLSGTLPPGAPGTSTAATSGVASSQAPPALQRRGSMLRQEVGSAPSPVEPRRGGGAAGQSSLRAGVAGIAGTFPAPYPTRQESTRTTDRTDALWAEMQATLEEVELSASGGTRVFGPDHDAKLAELRQAQIALAQAWARSEADEAIETTLSATEGDVRNVKSAATGSVGGEAVGKTEAGSTAATSARPGSSGAGGGERLGAKLEEETEVDILLARKRREANDRYFHKVNQGVLDVVAKLEEVAVAMRAVEQESKDVWGENDSTPSSAKP